jgi:hypothetical protein
LAQNCPCYTEITVKDFLSCRIWCCATSYQSVGATYWLYLQWSNPGNYISISTLTPVPIWILSPNKAKVYFLRIRRGVDHKDTNRMAYFCIQMFLVLPPDLKWIYYYIYQNYMHCFLRLLLNKSDSEHSQSYFFVYFWPFNIRSHNNEGGHAEAHLVEALRYKSEGRGFDSRLCHFIFH